MNDRSVSLAVNAADAVVFDLFHTLTSVDSVRLWKRNTYDILGITREVWFDRLFERSRERLIGRIKDPVEIMRSMAHAIDESIPDEAIEVAARNRLERFENALVNMPVSTISVLGELKARKKKLGLISNADATEVAAWARSPVAHVFDSVVISCDVGLAKPDRDIYMKCLGELGVSPGRAVYVGDGGSGELPAAREVGMTTVMMAGVIREMWPERIEPRLPYADFVIESLEELLE
jgi:putative hydrolase of the HAD superfamily